LHAGYLRLQTLNQNMQCLFSLHCNNVCTCKSQRYVIRTLSVLFTVMLHYKRPWSATVTKYGERNSQNKSEVPLQEERKDNRRKNRRENLDTNNSTKCSTYWMFWCNNNNHHRHHYCLLLSLPLLRVIIFIVNIIIINIHYRLKTCPSVFANFRSLPTCNFRVVCLMSVPNVSIVFLLVPPAKTYL
jgi:hypothetical protein